MWFSQYVAVKSSKTLTKELIVLSLIANRYVPLCSSFDFKNSILS